MARGAIILVLAVFAGAAAGMAVQLTGERQGAAETGPEAPTVTAAEHSEVESIARSSESRIDELAAAVEELKSENRDLARQIVELEGKLVEVREAGVDPAGPMSGAMTFKGPNGEPVKFAGRPQVMSFGGNGKGFGLMGLPEEEKWAKIREDLVLDAYQETELKRIAEEYRNSFKDLISTDTDGSVKLGKIDIGKVMKASVDRNERVRNLLSDEQYRKYEEGNYGAAIGMGGATSVSVSTTFETNEGK